MCFQTLPWLPIDNPATPACLQSLLVKTKLPKETRSRRTLVGMKKCNTCPFLQLTRKIYFIKELSLCHKLLFSNSYIFAILCYRLQTKISVRSNNLSLKYQKFSWLGMKDIGLRKFEFVAKSQFLYLFDVSKFKRFTSRRANRHESNLRVERVSHSSM